MGEREGATPHQKMPMPMPMPRRRLPHFFEIYSPASSSKRLKIPSNFTRHVEGKTSGLASLEGPSGNFWQVELIHENDSLSLHCGWHTFVSDNSIVCGDLLVFRYNGNLHFSVQIFDESACEKEVAFHSKCSQDSIDHSYGTGEGDGDNDEATHLPKKFFNAVPDKMKLCQIQDDERYWIEDVVRVEKHQSSDLFAEPIIPLRSVACYEKCDMKSGSIKGQELDLPSTSHILRSSSAEEKKIARSFKSSFPYFVRIMKKFNVSGSYTLNIPYQFSMEHLPKCRITIVLRNLKGERWTVNSVPTTKVHTSHTFCGGWMAFVRANGIRIEDTCVFELVHQCEMRVHIIGGPASNDNEGNVSDLVTIMSVATSQEDPNGIKRKKRKSMVVNSQVLKKVKKLDKKSLKTSLEGLSNGVKRHASASMTVGKASIGTAPNLQTTDCLSTLLSLHEEKVARSFKSSFPSFVRVMKRFNISGSYTLKVPHQFSIAYLPQCKTEIVLRNHKGETWTVNSVPDSKGRLSHTFCGGWLSFVRDNDIQMGDTCIFELVRRFEMRVHISQDGWGTMGGTCS